MKRILLVTLTFLFLVLSNLSAQHTHDGHTRCGSTQYMEMKKQQDPTLEQLEFDANQLLKYLQENKPALKGTDDLFITIPVVVHVIWKTSAQDIPDEQILSQIDVLNEDFRRLNSDTTQHRNRQA